MTTEPNDPLTLLRQAAVQMHEMFKTYVEAGFTDHQALYLVGQMIQSHRQEEG